MKHQISRSLSVSVALAAVLSLAACGGGGGGGDSTAAAPTPAPAPAPAPVAPAPVEGTPAPAPATNNSTINSTITPGTYTAASEEAAAYSLLNSERNRCGFGAVNQNANLDTAARGHVDWLLANKYQGHYQVTGTPGFTGVNPSDRVAAAGYAWSAVWDEQTVRIGSTATAGYGAESIRYLLSAIYHTQGMLSGARDVGISIRSSDQAGTTAANGSFMFAQYNLAVAAGSTAQQQGSAEVLTYPCAGTTGTVIRAGNESPNPFPGRDLSVNPVGQPIYIRARAGQTLIVTSASVKAVGASTTVPLLPTFTQATDPNTLLASNEAVIFPNAGLDANTNYTVTVAGTNNGEAFTKAFTFQTGTYAP